MARYVTTDDFKTDYGEQLLIRLFAIKALPTDPEPNAAAAALKFEKIAEEVCDEIDGYLRRRHSLPLTTVPEDLKAKALRMVHYYGQLKSPSGNVTEKVRDDFKDIKRWLEQLGEGRVDLGMAVPPTENSDRSVEITSNERVLTESRLKGIL